MSAPRRRPRAPGAPAPPTPLNADPPDRPEFERERRLTVTELRFGRGPVQVVGGRDLQWVCLSFAQLNSQTGEAWILMDTWPQAGRAPHVAETSGASPTGLMPSSSTTRSPARPSSPACSSGSKAGPGPLRRLPRGCPVSGPSLQARTAWQRAGRDAALRVHPRRAEPDPIIGQVTRDTDVDGKPYWALPDRKYEYRPKTPENHLKQFGAGRSVQTSRRSTTGRWTNAPTWPASSPLRKRSRSCRRGSLPPSGSRWATTPKPGSTSSSTASSVVAICGWWSTTNRSGRRSGPQPGISLRLRTAWRESWTKTDRSATS